MITIIHGDDVGQSRKHYVSEKEKVKDPVLFDKNISLTDLTQVASGGSLFTETKNIFIEEFLSGKKTNDEFKKIVDFIKNNSQDINYFFWSSKPLEKSTISLFKNSIQKAFNYPQVLWAFLDGISPKNTTNNIKLFHESLNKTSVDMIFSMLVRQFRLLLAISSASDKNIDEANRLAPWQRGKLQKQAKQFSTKKLKVIYKELLQIDLGQKSGTLGKNLEQSIDIFLSKI